MGKIEQVVSPDRYCVIPRVLIFPIDSQGKFLLLKGAESKRIWPGLWNGIGGHVEAGEAILQAAKRELSEETGLVCSKWDYCGEVMVDAGSTTGIAFFIFKALECAGALVESSEGNLAWFSPVEALEQALVEDLYYLIPRVSRFKEGDRPFWGLYRYDDQDQLVMRFID